jgi:hypothetical protein
MATISIHQVLGDLHGFVANNPTPRKVLGVGAILSPDEIDAVLGTVQKIQLTDVQKAQYTLAVAKTLSSSDADGAIEKTAKEAYETAKELHLLLCKITVALIFIDSRCKTNFAIEMKGIFRV